MVRLISLQIFKEIFKNDVENKNEKSLYFFKSSFYKYFPSHLDLFVIFLKLYERLFFNLNFADINEVFIVFQTSIICCLKQNNKKKKIWMIFKYVALVFTFLVSRPVYRGINKLWEQNS